jgi:Lipase (class 3)
MSDISVSGGSGGIGARYEDIVFHSQQMSQTSQALLGLSDDAGRLVFNDSLVASVLLCPVEAADAEAALIAATTGPDGLLPTGMAIGATALVARGAVEAYGAADAALAATADALAAAGGFVVGMALPGLLAIGAVGAAGVLTMNPALAAYVHSHRLQLADAAMTTIYDNPWLLEGATQLSPTMLQGTAFSLAALLGPQGVPLLSAASGGQWPTTDYESSVSGLQSLAGVLGLLRDSGGFEVNEVPDSESWRSPNSVQGVFDAQSELGGQEGVVQISTVRGADGVTRYIVQIPGTQDWSPVRGGNVVDLTSNVQLMTQRPAEVERQVIAAMEQAGIPADAPVMLAGHSQGGITAATLSANGYVQNRFTVTSVVTGGSPIGNVDIPDDVSVLSIEHEQDPVPMLDGNDNPDRPNWVTVRRELSAAEGTPDGARAPSVAEAHGTPHYSDTGAIVDRSNDSSISSWRQRNAAFFEGQAEVRRFAIEPVE